MYFCSVFVKIHGFGGLVVSMLASGTQDHGFAPGRSRRNFRAKKSSACLPSVREVKPFAPCRRFAACQRSLNGVKRRHFGKITGPFSPTVPPLATRSACVDGDVEASGGERWERLKGGESNGKLPLRTCLECSVPESYRSPDWALVPAKPA
jgi:hypothetical protein